MQEEESLGKAYDNQLMKRLIRYLTPYRWYVALGILTSIAVTNIILAIKISFSLA